MNKLVILLSALVLSACASTGSELPEVDENGLELRRNTSSRVVYVRPGASLEAYKRVVLLDCFVEFAEGWQRDYNRQVRGAGNRVTEEDMERIRQELAAEFRRVFTQELQDDGGYEIVDEQGPDVLILRPAIINLRVTAPDLKTPGRATTVVNSVGQMTLFLELFDSVSNEMLARATDRKEARTGGTMRISNSVNNRAEAGRILRRWAIAMREALDASRAAAAEGSGAER